VKQIACCSPSGSFVEQDVTIIATPEPKLEFYCPRCGSWTSLPLKRECCRSFAATLSAQ
jgi:hypothetical protein